MRKNSKKILLTLLIVITSTFIGINSYAHSGRTDSSGGHKDNKNKSGLGSYHYHCGGNPAHLHTNGVCPYSTSSSSSKSSTSSSSSSKSSSSSSSTSKTSSNTKSTSTVPTTIVATGIQINEDIKSMDIGESKNLTATITPNDTTNKNIEWKSSDESIMTVNATGEITAKKAGVVDITASTSNGKTNTIKVTVNEEEKVNSSNIISTSAIVSNKINNDNTNNESASSNPIGGIAAVGLLGGGSYLGYKKYKKSK